MKKGFTLIELLAVIVILAIIALIATPMILGVIDDAKQGAAKSSALGYIDAVEKATILAEVSPATYTAIPAGVYDVVLDSATGEALAKISLKGAKPTAGYVVVGTDGSIVAAELYFNTIHASKYVIYVNNTSTVKTYVSGTNAVTPTAIVAPDLTLAATAITKATNDAA